MTAAIGEMHLVKLNVLVVTKTYSTSLGVIRSLGRAGRTVDLFYVEGTPGVSKIVSSSRYVRRTILAYGRRDEEIVDRIAREYAGREAETFLFPTDDYAASLIDRFADRLKGFRRPTAGDGQPGRITALMDKAVQSRLARDNGFPTAREWIIPLGDGAVRIPGDVAIPCFVKPLVSARGFKNELGVCRTREALQEKLLSLQKASADRSIMVQELLDITQEYSMSGLCLGQQIVLPAIVKKLRVAEKERGVTLYGELVDVDTIAPVRDALFRTLQALDYTGMFDMEIMCTPDKMYFGEINLRSGGPNFSYCAAGVNLPEMLLAHAEGAPVPSGQIALHKRFLYEKAAWEDCEAGFMTKDELDGLYREADILLLDQPDDPGPGQAFERFKQGKLKPTAPEILRRKLKSAARRIFGRW